MSCMRFAFGAISAAGLGVSLAMTAISAADDAGGPATLDGSTARPVSGSDKPPIIDNRGSTEGSTGATAATAGSRPSATSGEGYTWRSEKRKLHKPQGHRRLDPKRPFVQAPGFQIMADGTSVVSLAMSQPVSVVESRVGKRFEYRLDTAQVGVDNNLNPLVTGHFPTPLLRAALRREKGGVVLVLHLRENLAPKHVVRAGPAGAVLEVTLPKPMRTFAPPASATSSRERKPLDSKRSQ